jgi:hypothetical protein
LGCTEKAGVEEFLPLHFIRMLQEQALFSTIKSGSRELPEYSISLKETESRVMTYTLLNHDIVGFNAGAAEKA